jgi:hypothetical protein
MSKSNTEIIEQAYEQSNYAGLEKIYKLIRKTNQSITKNEVKEFLNNQEQEQILKQTVKPKDQGHITALSENENIQMDIYDLSKYSKFNSNYKFIFAMVDVFTRKLYAEPLKDKSINSTTDALKQIMKRHNIKPNVLTSDNDSSFLGEEFQSFLKQHNILLITNVKDDHNALGIIDNMAKRLKLTFGKIFLKTQKKNWINYLNQIISNYNNSNHRSLNNLSPNEVMETAENEKMIFDLNIKKSHKNQIVTDLEPNDKVRIKIKGMFTKSSEPQFSDEVYIVQSINNRSVTLTNGQVKKRQNLLKVPQNTLSKKTNVIKENNKVAKQDRILKQVGIDESNIIANKTRNYLIRRK